MCFRRERVWFALWRLYAILSFTAICVALPGCGNGLAQVSGQVTVDGQPLRGGSGDVRVTVKFQPASGIGPTAIGIADENGNYSLGTGSQTGIPAGEYVVTCSASELVRQKDSQAVIGGRQITDQKYADGRTSGLKFTVQPGNNEFNIPLISTPKATSRPGT